LAPLASWIALRGMTDLAAPALLGGAVLFWVAGFDILYACQDAEYDRKAKLQSIPARLGIAHALRFAAACHLLMWLMLAALAIASPHLNWIFAAGLGLLAVILLYEHALVRPNDLTRVNKAFFQVNAIISIGLFALGIVQLTLKR
jgi:4-hydroxybenzoate polyprenyltransferase